MTRVVFGFLAQTGAIGSEDQGIPGSIGGPQVNWVVAWFLAGLFAVLVLVFLCACLVGRFNPRVRQNLRLIFLLELLLFLAIVAVIAVAYMERHRRGLPLVDGLAHHVELVVAHLPRDAATGASGSDHLTERRSVRLGFRRTDLQKARQAPDFYGGWPRARTLPEAGGISAIRLRWGRCGGRRGLHHRALR